MMEYLEKDFDCRADAISYLQELCPWAVGEASEIRGGRVDAEARLAEIDPINYGKTRNFGDGKVTGLSPYVHHGLISLTEIRDYALTKVSHPEQMTKFVQELAWREFWQIVAQQQPEWLWQDAEPYKTGFQADDYADELPEDIRQGQTDLAAIDAFIMDLLSTGYVHNHARMYLASYVVHFRRVKWQAGAAWFLEHLLDGDEASNNFSWQWVASTFSNKPYIFNLENVAKYFSGQVDVSMENNVELDASYEDLSTRLFPNLGGAHV